MPEKIFSSNLSGVLAKSHELETKANSQFPDNLPNAWKAKLKNEANESYFKELTKFLNQEYRAKKIVYPERQNILRALQETDLPQVKVVILGQDPYAGVGQAIGLSFAVPNSLKPKPPSLMNIFKEISSDLKLEVDPIKSDLSGWVRQGVLLLNTVLTVRANEIFSHRNKGWEEFTDRVIETLSERDEPLIFLLWGAAAQAKTSIINTKKHFILKAAHPSPLSAQRGFMGCKHFSKVNEILTLKLKQKPIDWSKTSLNP